MIEVFFLRRHYRDVGVVCVLLFCGMAAFSVYSAIAACPPERRILALCVFLAFWGFLIALAVWLLLAYLRESLTIIEGRVVQKGIVRSREMDFAEVIEVRWRTIPHGGSVVLRSAFTTIKVHLDNFEPEQRRRLIRLFRSSLSCGIQRDWEHFCGRVALPLLKRGVDAPLSDSEVLVTRRRWDWYFLPVIFLLAVVGVVCAWQLQKPRYLLFPGSLVPLWLVVRFTTPKKGTRSQRLSKAREQGVLLFLLIWWVVAMAGLRSFEVFRPHLRFAPAWAVAAIVVWLAVLFFGVYRAGRRRPQAQQAAAKVAVEEWERLEGT